MSLARPIGAARSVIASAVLWGVAAVLVATAGPAQADEDPPDPVTATATTAVSVEPSVPVSSAPLSTVQEPTTEPSVPSSVAGSSSTSVVGLPAPSTTASIASSPVVGADSTREGETRPTTSVDAATAQPVTAVATATASVAGAQDSSTAGPSSGGTLSELGMTGADVAGLVLTAVAFLSAGIGMVWTGRRQQRQHLY